MPSRSPAISPRPSLFLCLAAMPSSPPSHRMVSLRTRMESWIREQTARVGISWPPSMPPQWRWPPWRGRRDRREQEKALREEFQRQRLQLNDLCRAVKADSVADLQEILCSMVLSECVYKRPTTDMIWYINKFKSDFGGQIVSLERVQPSLEHVPHRYLLAETGDTIYASFIGTKQYKDVIADANILQGVLFHEDNVEYDLSDIESDQLDKQKKYDKNIGKPFQAKRKRLKEVPKPAAHRGFLARAKGIPALELYKLAQEKNRKLVLCGHSLGGAVAVLSTLAILRVLASSSLAKEHENVPVKCITFSQPPVGNAALKDYVHQKGWQHYFKTYCIPEDLVPRILSPAYFHHYNSQVQQPSSHPGLDGVLVKQEDENSKSNSRTPKRNNGERLVLGVGPVQTSFWRLSKLVPLEGVRKHLNVFRKLGTEDGDISSIDNGNMQSAIYETDPEPQSLEIQEGSDGISLTPFLDTEKGTIESNGNYVTGKSSTGVAESRGWRRVPYLPSYVPFGQLYLLGSSSVESLSEAEYSKMTSVRSVITELRERFQSHSMKSYRSRFQKLYETCMCINTPPFLGMEQLPQFPHLQQLLGLSAPGAVELAHIMEPPVIQTATSILPLGWTGVPGDRNAQPLKVDIVGHGLHLCKLVQAQVNGSWCSTVVESLTPVPAYSTNDGMQPQTQKMRIFIGPPLKQPPKYPVIDDSLRPSFSIAERASLGPDCNIESFSEDGKLCSGSFDTFIVYCTSDFLTVCKEVHVRTRRVRLLGFEGAGKTSLFRALLSQGRQRNDANFDIIHADVGSPEVVAGGIRYLDSAGVNLQELHLEVSRFREELQIGARELSRKTDLVVLVHNLSNKIPWFNDTSTSVPALSLLLNEAKAHEIPWVLAITNKFSVSAHQQKMLIDSAMEAYKASPDMTVIVNSCPFVIPTASSNLQPLHSVDDNLVGNESNRIVRRLPFNIARLSFQKKVAVMPVEGITAFRQLVHRVLASNEEMAFQELANERFSLQLAKEQENSVNVKQDSEAKESSVTAAAVGASLGAGLGLVMAVVMGAASALRKP
ncbi:hypothetical protein OPV22_022927 [Ensete ventricosum]|uniref:Fungal lipase-type domain-containing protein n=1 Tax=Ensete ventricosum TaxID=4639 RepID=A0AAV8QTL6_ENSVE|nr:hypothetical protein OPV22_022927 [Ensete ventricosum]